MNGAVYAGIPMLVAGGEPLAEGALLAAADALARELPEGPAAVNLCESRAKFLTAFLALLMRGQACLLPPSRVPAVIDEVVREHPGAYRIDDARVAGPRGDATGQAVAAPVVPAGRVVVVGYTSGSTGRPSANPKTWESLRASARLNSRQLRALLPPGAHDARPWIVATVPSQHMYGLEMTVLLPLLGGMSVHGGHPLYPADVRRALEEVPEPRILVTTPVHLRALVQSVAGLPRLAAIVSATAPLPRELAAEAERRFEAPLLEFFGSTETCVIASRRTAVEAGWRPYLGVELLPQAEGSLVRAPWLPGAVRLMDVLELQDDGCFIVRGRHADMVEVGGKRASLADLTRRLLSVPGVSDAVVFQPDAAEGAVVRRLAALAVAEGLSESAVLERLAPLVDPVFLPRPLVLLPRLPRNEVGKLPRERLLEALKR